MRCTTKHVVVKKRNDIQENGLTSVQPLQNSFRPSIQDLKCIFGSKLKLRNWFTVNLLKSNTTIFVVHLRQVIAIKCNQYMRCTTKHVIAMRSTRTINKICKETNLTNLRFGCSAQKVSTSQKYVKPSEYPIKI